MGVNPMRRFLCHLIAVAAASLMLPSAASAYVIFDQTVDLEGQARASDFSFPNQAADDFLLQSGASTVTDVHWWGVYAYGNTPELDNFTIRFYADAGGAPAIVPLAEYAVGNIGRVDTGLTAIPNQDVYVYSANIPSLILTANTTYWLSIVNDTAADLDDDWYWLWEVGGVSATRGQDGQAWSSGDVRLGFQLTNDALALPEPAAWTLFAAGLAGLGLLARRRKHG
jgi:hypothetical protein